MTAEHDVTDAPTVAPDLAEVLHDAPAAEVEHVAEHGAHVALVNAAGLDLIRETIAPDLTDPELRLFGQIANRVGLDPFARQIYATKRGGKMVVQTGIDGYRLIARRTGEMRGRLGPYFAANDGKGWRVGENGKPLPWLDTTPPAAAMVGIIRAGDDEPTWGLASWAEYAITGRGDEMWRKMPSTMLAKCAEAQAIRATFPTETAGIYTEEEMAQAGAPDAPRSTSTRSGGPAVAGERIDPWHAAPRDVAAELRRRNLNPAGTVPDLRKRLADAMGADPVIEVEAEADEVEEAPQAAQGVAEEAPAAEDAPNPPEGVEAAPAGASDPVEFCSEEGCGANLDETGGTFTGDGRGWCPEHSGDPDE